MEMHLEHAVYDDLSGRQQENYNFQKLSAILASYGYSTVRLTDDAQGADFIAQHSSGKYFYKIQLKGRIAFKKVMAPRYFEWAGRIEAGKGGRVGLSSYDTGRTFYRGPWTWRGMEREAMQF